MVVTHELMINHLTELLRTLKWLTNTNTITNDIEPHTVISKILYFTKHIQSLSIECPVHISSATDWSVFTLIWKNKLTMHFTAYEKCCTIYKDGEPLKIDLSNENDLALVCSCISENNVIVVNDVVDVEFKDITNN